MRREVVDEKEAKIECNFCGERHSELVSKCKECGLEGFLELKQQSTVEKRNSYIEEIKQDEIAQPQELLHLAEKWSNNPKQLLDKAKEMIEE